jgi:hypothetical protein
MIFASAPEALSSTFTFYKFRAAILMRAGNQRSLADMAVPLLHIAANKDTSANHRLCPETAWRFGETRRWRASAEVGEYCLPTVIADAAEVASSAASAIRCLLADRTQQASLRHLR